MTVITASRATFDARYAAVITRHPTHSEQPAAAVDDGDQDAHTTRGRPPPERARRSTAALRSVGGPQRRQLQTQRPRPRPRPDRSHYRRLTINQPAGGQLSTVEKGSKFGR